MTIIASLNIPQRIQLLRDALKAHALDAYIITSCDPHISEYLPARWQGREVFSGFTGSAGSLIVSSHFAGLWVDSRYWVQAEYELKDSGIEVIRAANANAFNDWLVQHLKAGQSVGIDGQSVSVVQARQIAMQLKKKDIHFKTDIDLLESIWCDREKLPTNAIYEHDISLACVSRAEKIKQVRQAMAQQGATHHCLSTLDDIAWLLNLRGSDVNFNPVFVAHALIDEQHVHLFTAPEKLSPSLVEKLKQDGVLIQPYDHAATAMSQIHQNASACVLIDPKRITQDFYQKLNGTTIIENINPSTLHKSCKTPQEVAHIRQAMAQDGAALCHFFAWLEQALDKGEAITELTIDEKITAARAARPHYVGLSFSTIAGFNANGALPHYRATQESHASIRGNGLLLIDSGGQYLNGTTDITRVVPIGEVHDEHKRDYTLVLKGMIQLSMMVFPKGTYSTALDSIARAPMWKAGINFGHGVGHGVGYFMNVHEGPQSISTAIPDANMVMKSGMITSNEPGIYREGKWGIRIENLLHCIEHSHSEFGEFLAFEDLTLCPIDTRLIDKRLLIEDEIIWLNHYHQQVRERLSPYVEGDAKAWLEKRTQAI